MFLKKLYFFIIFAICLHFPILVYAAPFNSIHTNIQEINKNSTQQEIEPITMIFEATAYDLSIQCCGKSYQHPARGITRNGYNLNGKTHQQAMTVASNDFPLGTKLDITFKDSAYNGIYVVRDTGNMKSGVLDVFVGDYGEKVSRQAIRFGRQQVTVEIKEE